MTTEITATSTIEELAAEATAAETNLTVALATNDLTAIIEQLFEARGILSEYTDEDHEVDEASISLAATAYVAAGTLSTVLTEDETIGIAPLAALFTCEVRMGVTLTREDIIEFADAVTTQASEYIDY